MFYIYTIVAELEAENTESVLDLLERYPFKAAQDFFTVSRDHVDYLEILKEGRRLSVGYIAAGADESIELAADADLAGIKKAVQAFCDGDPRWQDSLGERPAAAPFSPPDFQNAPTREAIHAEVDEAFHINSAAIKPKTAGCAPIWVVIVLLGLGVIGYTLFPLLAHYFGR